MIRKRWRIDAVRYQPMPGGLAFYEAGRQPGGTLYRSRRQAEAIARMLQEFYEMTVRAPEVAPQFEVVDIHSIPERPSWGP